MGSIFQGGGEGGLRMLQSEGGCLLWGQFFRGGGVRTLDDTTLLSLIFANFHVVFLIEKGPVSNKIH